MTFNKITSLLLVFLSTNSIASMILKDNGYKDQLVLPIKTRHRLSDHLLKHLSDKDLLKIYEDRAILSSLREQISTLKNSRGTILDTNKTSSLISQWHHLDPELDKVEGVSSEKFYHIYNQKIDNEIIVAVLDSGIDVNHEDLQGKVWINKAEIPNNGIDDDKNGYIDDVFGWNFIGAKDGMATFEIDETLANGMKLIQGNPEKQIRADLREITRKLINFLKKENLSEEEKLALEQLKNKVNAIRKSFLIKYQDLESLKETYQTNVDILKTIGLEVVNLEQVTKLSVDPSNKKFVMAKISLIDLLENDFSLEITEEQINFNYLQAQFCYNPNQNIREQIVADHLLDPNDRSYGNNNVTGPDSDHGTHIAGIIAANSENEIGVKGIAKNVKIMSLRITPEGDERDKDVANAIYYAVNNGAKIINLSFGKELSLEKELVDAALKYAQEKDVLIIHAAGNDTQDIDDHKTYPSKVLDDGQKIEKWIEVAANSEKLGSGFVAKFSNFGEKNVDLFAPGVEIYSTIANNKYKSFSGTSMSTPIVTGMAATLWAYNKNATALQIKNAILQGARKHHDLMVYTPAIGKILFSKLSSTGAVANLFESMEILNTKLD